MTSGEEPSVRLAELVAALSLATDLGLGQPQEHVLRQTLIATRLATAAGITGEQYEAVYYVSLLAWVGCVADSHELAHWYDDDVQIRADSYQVDKAGLPMLRFLLGHLAGGSRSLRRVTLTGRFFVGGMTDTMNSLVAHCQTTGEIATRLDVPDDVRRALPQAFERWDGKGAPDGLTGSAISEIMRVVQVADDAEVFHRLGGLDAATQMLRERRGTEFDPALVDLVVDDPESILGDLAGVDAWSFVIDGCAGLDRWLSGAELTQTLQTFGDYADLKSPWFVGHSRAVASLAADAARRCDAPPDLVTTIERAALVHRLGMIGVSSGIWDKPGPLTSIERERVRTVPYLTERVLSRQPRLRELGQLAALCFERMDGSGYPHGLRGSAIPMPARLLAAAGVWQSLAEARPYRPALSAQERVDVLEAEVAAGRLDAEAVRAVLGAAGHQVARRRRLVNGLTTREVEVLALLVRGWSNKQIAAALSVSPRTVGTHVEHIYAKTGVSTRGAAAMFAMSHGLVDASAPVEATPKIG
jgi:HD-GYP domain-containing protein (c-di-GMP phosphodiesterase class II)